jgi:siroheme synthase (precorrin-2 oxidase/ferrochelatase)
MRPNVSRAYVVKGRYGTYAVPTLAAVDNRLGILVRTLCGAKPDVAARIRHDIEALLDWRLELMAERGTTT